MSRQIKFRAWDKAEKQMFNDVEVLKNGAIIFFEMDDNAEPIHWFNNYGENYQEEFANDMIVMQYTGLKDKNGKEIYEGDIVQLKGCKPYEIAWDDTNAQFYLKRGSYGALDLNCGLHEYEVIGNIFEHSELIQS